MTTWCQRRCRMLVTLMVMAIGPAHAQTAEPPPVPIPVPDLTVFLDPPTGFVYVKLPAGWKFVGTVHPATLDSLPHHVRTSLLVANGDPSVPPCRHAHEAGEAPAAGRGPHPHARSDHRPRQRASAARTDPQPLKSPPSVDVLPDPQPATF